MPLIRRFTDFILRGRLQAMSVVVLFSCIPVINSLCLIITAFITLKRGIFEGALVTCLSAVPYVIAYFVSPGGGITLLPAPLVLAILLANTVFVWLFALFLRRFNSWTAVIELAGLMGVLLVIAVHIIQPNVQAWWGEHLIKYFDQMTAMVVEQKGEIKGYSKEVQVQAILLFKNYATGLMAVGILFNALLQVVLARWWQARLYNPGGLRKELYQIRLGYLSCLVFLLVLLISSFGNRVAIDVIPVLYVVFAVAGFSLIHCIAYLKRFKWLMLLLVYGLVITTFPYGFEMVAILGLFDTLFNLRARFARQS